MSDIEQEAVVAAPIVQSRGRKRRAGHWKQSSKSKLSEARAVQLAAHFDLDEEVNLTASCKDAWARAAAETEKAAKRVEAEYDRAGPVTGALALEWEASTAAALLAKTVALKEKEQSGSSKALLDAFRRRACPLKVTPEHFVAWEQALQAEE